MTDSQRDWGHVIFWEFHVRSDKQKQFEEAYGPDGIWAQFFRQGRGYRGTSLTRDSSEQGRYVTLDFWKSAEDYEAFKRDHGEEYKAIDEKCEALTESEREIGKLLNLKK